MKPEYTPLGKVTSPVKDARVKVRVIQKSEPRQSPNKKAYQRLLLQDDEGTTMRGTIFGDDINTFAAALRKYGQYDLAGVNITSIPNQYRSTGGEYQLSLNDKVCVTPLDLSACSDEPVFRHLSEVPRSHTPDDDLIDVVAAVVHVSEVRTVRRGDAEEKVREILLADQSCIESRPMKLAVWNEHALKEHSFYRTWPNSFMVIGITALRPIPYQGLTLKTTKATSFVDKPTGDKADKVRAWVQQNKAPLNSWRLKCMSMNSSDKTPTPVAEILEKKAETLWQDEKFWIQVVLSQLSDKDINCYVGCGSCGRSTTENVGSTFNCLYCRNPNATAAFRISMTTVADDMSASIKLTAFTGEAELICGSKSDDLAAMKQPENAEPFAKLLDELRKKEILLQISPTNALTISNTLKWIIRQVEVPADAE